MALKHTYLAQCAVSKTVPFFLVTKPYMTATDLHFIISFISTHRSIEENQYNAANNQIIARERKKKINNTSTFASHKIHRVTTLETLTAIKFLTFPGLPDKWSPWMRRDHCFSLVTTVKKCVHCVNIVCMPGIISYLSVKISQLIFSMVCNSERFQQAKWHQGHHKLY